MRSMGSVSRSIRRRARGVIGVLSSLALVGAVLGGFAPATLAATSNNVSISPSAVVLQENQTTTVNVVATVTSTVYSWHVDVAFDPNVASFAGCSNAPFSCNQVSPNVVSFAGAFPTGHGESGTVQLGSVTFKGVATGMTQLVPNVLELNDPSGAPISATTSDGELYVPPVVSGLSTPAQGPTSGGTNIAIYGSGFAQSQPDNLTASDGTSVQATLGLNANGVDFGGVAASNVQVKSNTEIDATSPAATSGMPTVPTGGDCVNGCTTDVQVVTPVSAPSGGNVVSGVSASDEFTYVTSGTIPGVSLQPSSSTIEPAGTGDSTTLNLMATPPSGGLSSWDILVNYPTADLTATCTQIDSTNTTCGTPSAGTLEISGDVQSGSAIMNPTSLAQIVFTAAPGVTDGTLANVTMSLTTFNSGSVNDSTTATVTGATITIASTPMFSASAPGSPNPKPSFGWAGGGGPDQGIVYVSVYGSDFNVPNVTVTVNGQPATVLPSSTPTELDLSMPANGVFGDVTGSGATSAVDALCILQAVVGQTLGTCSRMQTPASIIVTNTDGSITESATLSNAYTFNNFDVSGTDTNGSPKALDAQCVLYIAAGVNPGSPSYPSVCEVPVADLT